MCRLTHMRNHQEETPTERFLRVAAALKAEAGVTGHVVRNSLTGKARRDRSIVAPEGKTRRQLFVLAHECAHVVLGHVDSKKRAPRHVEEFEAEKWALAALRRHKIPVSRKMAIASKKYVAWRIEKARESGAIRVSRAALAYSRA